MFKNIFLKKEKQGLDPSGYYEKYLNKPITKMLLVESDKIIQETNDIIKGYVNDSREKYLEMKYNDKAENTILMTSFSDFLACHTIKTLYKSASLGAFYSDDVEKSIGYFIPLNAFYLFSGMVLSNLLEKEGIIIDKKESAYGLLVYFNWSFKNRGFPNFAKYISSLYNESGRLLLRITEGAEKSEEKQVEYMVLYGITRDYFIKKSTENWKNKDECEEHVEAIRMAYSKIIKKLNQV